MKSNFSRLLFLVKIAIAVFTIAFLVKTLHFHEIRSAFQNPKNSYFILFAGILLLPNLFLQCFRWHYLLVMVHPQLSISESTASLFGGMVAGFVTPGRIGDFTRPLFIKNADRLQVLGLVLLDKFYAFFPILICGIWGVVLFLSYWFHYNLYLVWPLCIIALFISGVTILLALHTDWTRNFLYHLTVLFPSRDKLRKIITAMDSFQAKQARILLLSSVLLYAIYITQFCFLVFAFQSIPWTTALTATTSTLFAKTLLPISIGDLGIREGAAVFFFLKFNVEKVTAFNSSLLLFTINIVIPTFLGLFFLPKLNIKKE